MMLRLKTINGLKCIRLEFRIMLVERVQARELMNHSHIRYRMHLQL